MPEIVVAAETRAETGKNANRRLRTDARIPGVLYGGSGEPRSVSVAHRDVLQILRSASGENTLFDLELDGSRRKVILKEYQVQPVSGELLHADFFELALDKQLEVRVHIELVGTPLGVKNEGGMLDFVTRELEVECLPADIPEKISVDVSGMALNTYLRVSDLAIPENVTCLTEADVVVAHVMVPRAAEAVAEPEAAEGEVAAEATGEAAAEDKDKDKDEKKGKGGKGDKKD